MNNRSRPKAVNGYTILILRCFLPRLGSHLTIDTLAADQRGIERCGCDGQEAIDLLGFFNVFGVGRDDFSFIVQFGSTCACSGVGHWSAQARPVFQGSENSDHRTKNFP